VPIPIILFSSCLHSFFSFFYYHASDHPTGKIEFIQGAGSNGNDLYIDHVSKLDFGQKSISLTDQDYKSTGHTFSVVDLTGIYSGWSLSVKQNAQFKGNGGNGKDLVGLIVEGAVTPVAPTGVPTSVNDKVAPDKSFPFPPFPLNLQSIQQSILRISIKIK
jgi:hypothetical protein